MSDHIFNPEQRAAYLLADSYDERHGMLVKRFGPVESPDLSALHEARKETDRKIAKLRRRLHNAEIEQNDLKRYYTRYTSYRTRMAEAEARKRADEQARLDAEERERKRLHTGKVRESIADDPTSMLNSRSKSKQARASQVMMLDLLVKAAGLPHEVRDHVARYYPDERLTRAVMYCNMNMMALPATPDEIDSAVPKGG